MSPWRRLAEAVALEGAAVLVTVRTVTGSAPREPGARLVVRPSGGFHGTIGGGQLEWEALAEAAGALAAGRGPAKRLTRVLGPDLGQCCGGRVTLLVETFDARDRADLARLVALDEGSPISLLCRLDPEGRVRRGLDGPAGEAAWQEGIGRDDWPVLLFGAGHLGRALALALAPLPVRLRWVDPRPDAFPPYVPANAIAVRPPDPLGEIAGAPADGSVLVMTHSHALDLALVGAALARADLPFVGLIGSATKRARFLTRLRAQGLGPRLAALACPLGVPGIAGKAPAVIAASIAAQLLQVREALQELSGLTPGGMAR